MLERKYNKAKKLIKNFQQQLEMQDKKFKTVVADLTEHITSLQSKLDGKGTISGVSIENFVTSQLIARMASNGGFNDVEISDADEQEASFASSSGGLLLIVTFIAMFQVGDVPN